MFHFYTPWKNKTPPILVPRKFQLIKQLFWKILILKYAVLQCKDFSKEVILKVKTNWKRFLWNWKCCKNFLFMESFDGIFLIKSHFSNLRKQSSGTETFFQHSAVTQMFCKKKAAPKNCPKLTINTCDKVLFQ